MPTALAQGRRRGVSQILRPSRRPGIFRVSWRRRFRFFPPAGPLMSKSSLVVPIAAGLVTAFVGFASSFAVVLKGLEAVGASDAQAASGLMALSIAMGLAGIVLSLWFAHADLRGLVDAGRGAARGDRRGDGRLSRGGRGVSRRRRADRRGGADQAVRARGGGDSLRRSPMRCWRASCSACVSPRSRR